MKFSTIYFFSFLGLLLCFQQVGAQRTYPQNYFRSPVDIPIYLSGNFAELRSNHFHSGIDIRTQGVEGKRLYAIADGYVWRLKVSPWGYGKAIYIMHPDSGYTSVYGHLQGFNDSIGAYVLDKQYENQDFELDIYPEPGVLPVKKGQVIGYSGNSGSSGGPHLHFEIRDAYTERPLNPLLFGFDIADTRPPQIYFMTMYPETPESSVNGQNERQIFNLGGSGKSYYVRHSGPVEVYGDISFGVKAYDFMNGSNFRCGIYTIEIYVDTTLVYSDCRDEFSFAQSRAINDYTDYRERLEERDWIHRSRRSPNNRLEFYKTLKNNGIYSFTDSAVHAVRYVLTDVAGNVSQINFAVKSSPQNRIEPEKEEETYSKLMHYSRANYFFTNNFMLTVPQDALYNILKFRFAEQDTLPGCYSPVFDARQNYVPLHKYITIGISAEAVPDSLRSKATICTVNSRGELSRSLGGTYMNGFVVATTRYFSRWALAVDTVPPEIVPLNISNNRNMRGTSEIRFKVTDDLSGIESYDGYIDGHWVMFDYDGKRDKISHTLGEFLEIEAGEHDFKLIVTDACGNEAVYEAKFYK